MPFETILAKEPPASGGFTWGLWRAKDVESWGSRIAVSAEYPIFRNMKHGLTIKEKWGTLISALLGIMSMVRLRLGTPPAKLER